MTAANRPADRLAGIEARVEAATEGPWEVTDQTYVTTVGRAVAVVPRLSAQAPENAAFIAHARIDLPATTAALRAVLALHVEYEEDGVVAGWCRECGVDYPCYTVRAITTALTPASPLTGPSPTEGAA